MIHFHVPAVPVAQPRPRATAINGSARMYEAKSGHAVHTYKASVRMAAQKAHPGAPLETPLKVTLVFVMPRPGRLRWKKRPMPRVPHTGKPDCDNLAKSTLDSLNGLLFADDSQVFDLDVSKWIASGDEQPHVEIMIQEHDQPF